MMKADKHIITMKRLVKVDGMSISEGIKSCDYRVSKQATDCGCCVRSLGVRGLGHTGGSLRSDDA